MPRALKDVQGGASAMQFCCSCTNAVCCYLRRECLYCKGLAPISEPHMSCLQAAEIMLESHTYLYCVLCCFSCMRSSRASEGYACKLASSVMPSVSSMWGPMESSHIDFGLTTLDKSRCNPACIQNRLLP